MFLQSALKCTRSSVKWLCITVSRFAEPAHTTLEHPDRWEGNGIKFKGPYHRVKRALLVVTGRKRALNVVVKDG